MAYFFQVMSHLIYVTLLLLFDMYFLTFFGRESRLLYFLFMRYLFLIQVTICLHLLPNVYGCCSSRVMAVSVCINTKAHCLPTLVQLIFSRQHLGISTTNEYKFRNLQIWHTKFGMVMLITLPRSATGRLWFVTVARP